MQSCAHPTDRLRRGDRRPIPAATGVRATAAARLAACPLAACARQPRRLPGVRRTVRPHESDKIVTTFRELGVLPEICDALERAGITTPFAIQEMTLSVALLGTDLIGQARTGTGKTLAFGIPVLQRSVAPHDPDYAEMPAGQAAGADRRPDPRARAPGLRRPRPRREDRGLRVLTVYGGVGYDTQLDALEAGVDIVVGTPGPPHRPGQPPRARPLPRARARPRRGRRDARPRLPARRRAAAREDPRDPADDAVLGDHAGRDRRAGPHPHAAPDEHPRRVVVRQPDGAGDRAVHLPGPRPRQARDHRPASCRPRTPTR